MTFIFSPAIYRDSELWKLPRPVTSLRIQEAWDFERFKVPLADGDTHVGHSKQGIDIAIDGQFGSQDGTTKISEAEMFAVLEVLRSKLDVSDESEKFEFFLYYDGGSGTYRKFRECSAVRLEYDLSSPHLFSYAAIVHADDPNIYTTAPGV
jgi:hypothetical protein